MIRIVAIVMHLLYCRQNNHDAQESTSQTSKATISTNQQHHATDIINQTLTKSSSSKFNMPWYKRIFPFSSNVINNDKYYENQQSANSRQEQAEICEDFTRPSDTIAAPVLQISKGVRYIR